MTELMDWKNIPKHYIHARNIAAKTKGKQSLDSLAEIKVEYGLWRKKIDDLKGRRTSRDIVKMVRDLNCYYDFINQPKFRKEKGSKEGFASQSKFHSTLIEEFMYHLLSPIPKLSNKKNIDLGPTRAYSNLYFAPSNLESFEENSGLSINTKNQDFAISKKIELSTSLTKDKPQKLNVPIISIECKTYLDKTMFEGSVATAEKIKRGNPYSLFFIVTETYEVSADVDPIYSDIDQIYVLRKQSQRGAKKPIQADIIEDLYTKVERHLSNKWRNVDEKIKSGKLI